MHIRSAVDSPEATPPANVELQIDCSTPTRPRAMLVARKNLEPFKEELVLEVGKVDQLGGPAGVLGRGRGAGRGGGGRRRRAPAAAPKAEVLDDDQDDPVAADDKGEDAALSGGEGGAPQPGEPEEEDDEPLLPPPAPLSETEKALKPAPTSEAEKALPPLSEQPPPLSERDEELPAGSHLWGRAGRPGGSVTKTGRPRWRCPVTFQ